MKHDVHIFVRNCPRCQLSKADHSLRLGFLQPHSTPFRPFYITSTNFLTDLTVSNGYDSILVVVCLFSKRAFFLPTKKQLTAKGAAHLFLWYVFPVVGFPCMLISDQDMRFTSTFWLALFRSLGTELKMSTAFHPQTDGQLERVIEQLLTLIH